MMRTIKTGTGALLLLALYFTGAHAFSQGFDDGWNSGGCVLTNGASADFTREFKSYRTYTIIASGGDGAIDVDLEIRDSRGRVVAEDKRSEKTAVVVFRPLVSGDYTIRLTLAKGIGKPLCHFMVLVDYGGWDIPTETFVSVLIRLAAVATVLEAEVERFYGYIMRPGEKITMSISGLRGDYYAFAVGSDHVSDLDLVVRRSGLTIARDDFDDAYPMCEFSNLFGSPVSVEVSYYSGKGAAFVMVAVGKKSSSLLSPRRL